MLSAAASAMVAVCVLAALGLGLAAWAVVLFRRSVYPPAQSLVFGLNYLVARLLWRVEVSGPFPIPPGQGAVIVCNHRSSCDPSFIAVAVGRLVHWLVAKEFVEHRLMGWFLNTCEVIPTSRAGSDTAATRLAIRLAREGGLVGLFPEGRINTSDELLLPGRPGAALIALRARVPVVPCYISGSPFHGTVLGPLVTPARVRLVIGRPLDLSEYYEREDQREVLKELTKRLLGEIAALAGQPEFQPRLAGRFYKPGLADD